MGRGFEPLRGHKKTTASFRKPLAAKMLQKLAVFLSWLTTRINSHSFVFPHCISQWRTNNGLGSATVSNQNLNLTSTLMVASVKRLWLMPLNLLNVGSNPHVIRHSPPLHKERLGFRLYPSTSWLGAHSAASVATKLRGSCEENGITCINLCRSRISKNIKKRHGLCYGIK